MRYGLGPEVLSDVTFRIAPRSFQFLTGPSGAGKTTLLRLILLSVRPTRGLVSIFGEEVSGISAKALTGLRRRMGVVFQDFRLLDHLTTYENVALPLRVQGRSETSYRAEVVELLRWWSGLGERMHALPPLLSGGEKQRAAIARALIARPELLLADEPTGNVDPGLGRRLLRLFPGIEQTRHLGGDRPPTTSASWTPSTPGGWCWAKVGCGSRDERAPRRPAPGAVAPPPDPALPANLRRNAPPGADGFRREPVARRGDRDPHVPGWPLCRRR